MNGNEALIIEILTKRVRLLEGAIYPFVNYYKEYIGENKRNRTLLRGDDEIYIDIENFKYAEAVYSSKIKPD